MSDIIIVALLVAALILAAIALTESRRNLVAWSALLIAIALLIPRLQR